MFGFQPCNFAAQVYAVGSESVSFLTYTMNSTSFGGDINFIRYTLTFAGNAAAGNGADAQDGRVIVITATSHAGAPTLVSDTGGTPVARLTTGQLSGTGASVSFTSGTANDVMGNFTTVLFVRNTVGSTSSVTLA